MNYVKKNTTSLKMQISKNPTDKSCVITFENFCQVDFWIFSFLREWCFFDALFYSKIRYSSHAKVLDKIIFPNHWQCRRLTFISLYWKRYKRYLGRASPFEPYWLVYPISYKRAKLPWFSLKIASNRCFS